MSLVRIGYITDLNQREKLGHMLLTNLIETFRVEAIIIGGDCNLDPQELPLREKVSYYFLSGDKDDIYITKTSRKLGNLLDGNIIYLSNITFAGVSGLDYYQSIVKLLKTVSQVRGKVKINVLVTHHPPKGCLDYIETLGIRVGLASVKELIVRLEPSIVLTGHINNRGICYVNEVPVVNPGPAEEGYCAILEISSRGLPESISLLKLQVSQESLIT